MGISLAVIFLIVVGMMLYKGVINGFESNLGASVFSALTAVGLVLSVIKIINWIFYHIKIN